MSDEPYVKKHRVPDPGEIVFSERGRKAAEARAGRSLVFTEADLVPLKEPTEPSDEVNTSFRHE